MSADSMTQEKNKSPYAPTVGVAIGQKRHPSAIAVVEMEKRQNDATHRDEKHFLVRFLERLPPGSTYPEVAGRVGEICHRVRVQRDRSPKVYVDATGIGQTIVDLVEHNTRNSPDIWAVYFTHGDRRTEQPDEKQITLGKAFLVGRLQTLLQCQCLHLPATAEAHTLAGELLDYEVRLDENANERYGAFRVGTQDDLVTALGLAVQVDLTGVGSFNIGPDADFSDLGRELFGF